MKLEVLIAWLTVLSFTASTLFTDGIEDILNNFVEQYHHRVFFYFAIAFAIMILMAYISTHITELQAKV